MDALLVAITVVSVGAAVFCGFYAWRLRREEQRRSEARVAALSDAIDAADVASHPATRPAATTNLFTAEHSAAARGTPVVKLAAAAVMGVFLVVAVAMSNRGAGDVVRSGDAGVAESRHGAPLELISMRHEREGSALKVSGLVRNPGGGDRVARVTAVVLAFDKSGVFVASGRASLDFTTLEPGDESPFVVSIPARNDIARYRVSFRTDAGVVQHVDRRAEQTRLATAGVRQ